MTCKRFEEFQKEIDRLRNENRALQRPKEEQKMQGELRTAEESIRKMKEELQSKYLNTFL